MVVQYSRLKSQPVPRLDHSTVVAPDVPLLPCPLRGESPQGRSTVMSNFEVNHTNTRRGGGALLSRCKMSFLIQLFAFFAILGSSPAARANDIYVSQSGGGSGSSCADTLPASFFNAAS